MELLLPRTTRLIPALLAVSMLSVPQCLAAPESDESLLRRVGNRLYNEKKLSGSRVVYQKLIQLCPTDALAHARLLKILVDENRYADAVTEGRKAVTLNPSDAQCHFLLGLALERSENLAAACDQYEKAHALYPAHVQYIIGLARAYSKSGKAPESVNLLKSAIKSNPESIMLWERLAERALDAGQNTTARSALQRCADLISKQGLKCVPVNTSEFISAGWRLLARDPWNVEAARTQLCLCYVLNNSTNAAVLIELAVKRFADRPEVFSILKEALLHRQDAPLSIEDAARRTSWDSLASYLDELKHDAEFRQLAANNKHKQRPTM